MGFIESLKQALYLKRQEDEDPWASDKINVPADATAADDMRPAPLPATTKPARDWTSPDFRVELPRDFPAPLGHHKEVSVIADAIDKELKKHGTSLKQVDRIHIAFPHKHPGMFPDHYDAARSYAHKLAGRMQQAGGAAGRVEWNIAEELVETKRLGRSEDQSSVHALTAKQEYVFNFTPGQTSTLALMGDNRKEFFVVVDTLSEQGTTFANLISHIRANGGVVVATVGADQLVQEGDDPHARRTAQLSSKFADPSRNDGKLATLGIALHNSAKASGMDWTPAECIEMFETALNKNGNSVFAMTNGEVGRVIASVNFNHSDSVTFVGLLEKLEAKAVAASAVHGTPAAPAATAHKPVKHPQPGR